MVLLSILAFLCPPTWSHDENVDRPHLYHVIMGSCTLIVGVLKYFLIFGGFVGFDFYPLGLSSYGAFVHFCFSLSAHMIAWRECWSSTPVSCDHAIMHLDCWSIKIFSHFWGFYPGFDFYPLGLSSYGAFVHFGFSLSAHMIAWRECWLSTPVSCDHAIVHIDCWSIKIFSHFGGFYPLWFLSFGAFVLWWSCPFLLFSVHPQWSHDENVDRPHLYHVIMGSCTLIVGVLKYFLILGGFVRFDFYPLGLSSCDAFVHFCFSLSAHVITWRECWSSTPVSCDHGIVHLDCWSIKIFSHFGGFCPLWFLSFGSFILWCFCPFWLFSVRLRDRMTRMLIVHTCIMWSWDRAPWLLEY